MISPKEGERKLSWNPHITTDSTSVELLVGYDRGRHIFQDSLGIILIAFLNPRHDNHQVICRLLPSDTSHQCVSETLICQDASPLYQRTPRHLSQELVQCRLQNIL
jgi:hypothetical protein